jgi:hypothetical protein
MEQIPHIVEYELAVDWVCKHALQESASLSLDRV